MSGPEDIDVAMPTYNSKEVISETLNHLSASEAAADVSIERLILVDNESSDGTKDIARRFVESKSWELKVISRSCSLPRARELAVEEISNEWFLFLDDDVRLSESYLRSLSEAIAPIVGGIQGRKKSRLEHPSRWVRRRSRRGGTHATLIRKEAVDGVSIPTDLTVLEDEYIRRYVESKGYLWVFNHRAVFEHASQERHPIGWEEGFLAGKYGLKPFHEVALNVPFSIMRGRNPSPHVKRTGGWIAGYLQRTIRGTPQTIAGTDKRL